MDGLSLILLMYLQGATSTPGQFRSLSIHCQADSLQAPNLFDPQSQDHATNQAQNQAGYHHYIKLWFTVGSSSLFSVGDSKIRSKRKAYDRKMMKWITPDLLDRR